MNELRVPLRLSKEHFYDSDILGNSSFFLHLSCSNCSKLAHAMSLLALYCVTTNSSQGIMLQVLIVLKSFTFIVANRQSSNKNANQLVLVSGTCGEWAVEGISDNSCASNKSMNKWVGDSKRPLIETICSC